MSRGIHLKQLTETDLGLLGLPGESLAHARPGPGSAEDPDTAARPSVHPAETPAPPPAPPPAGTPRAGPPPNPSKSPPGPATPIALEAESGEVPDLSALTREICQGLEDTLQLLALR